MTISHQSQPPPFISRSVDDFLLKGKAAGNSGRVILCDKNPGHPELISAKYNLKDYVLSFLKHLPLLKNLNVVQNYIDNLNLKNRNALTQFINALSNRYGFQPSRIALESIFSKPKITPLNNRTIRQLNEIASSYFGIGDAKSYSRTVTVNLWPYENMDKCGHASITITNNDTNESEHVSWWPSNDEGLEITATKDTLRVKIAKFLDKISSDKFDLASNFKEQLGGSNKSLSKDHRAEMSAGTRKKLDSGLAARKILEKQIINGQWPIEKHIHLIEKGPAFIKSEIKNLEFLVEKEKNRLRHDSLGEIQHSGKRSDLIKDLRRNIWLHNTLLTSLYIPRAIQSKDQSGKFGVVAQSIHLPMAGKNMITDPLGATKSRFAMFGLNESSITSEARHVKSNADAHLKLREAQAEFSDPQKTKERQISFDNLTQEIADLKVEILEKTNEISEFKSHDFNSKIKNLKEQRNQRETIITRLKSLKKEPAVATNKKHLDGINKEINSLYSGLNKLNIEKLRLEKDLAEAENELAKIKERDTEKYFEKAKESAIKSGDEIGYTFASDTNNCASMAVRILLSGGAENFVDLPKMTTLGISMIKPDEQFSNYVKAIQTEIDHLNSKADYILSTLEEYAPIPESASINPEEMKSFSNGSAKEWANLSDAEKTLWKPVIDIISVSLPKKDDDMKSMTTKTKKLVATSHEIARKIQEKPTNSSVEREMAIFLHKAFNMHKQQISALTTPAK